MKKKYEVEDFLKDPEFVKWVRDPDKESSEFWNSFVNGHPGSKAAMLKARELIKVLKLPGTPPPAEVRQEILEKIVHKINENELGKPSRERHRHKYIWWRTAAALVLLTGATYIFYHYGGFGNQSNINTENKAFTRESPSGVKVQTRLPDGSMAWLNADSKLVYKESAADSTRLVELRGEALFEVKENPTRPFIVKAGSWSVKALGTSFNVRNYETETNPVVALLSGKVLVANRSDKDIALQLLPGEKAVMHNQTRQLEKQPFDPVYEVGWKDGILVFEHANFEQVRIKLERWYGVKIHAPGGDFTLNWEIDGRYHDQSLERVLRHLSYTKAFEFEIKNNEVFLTETNP